ncbi:Glycerophosphodiester phosphodiesterase [Psidium guajava]|nr:Glycerophosphodiester phosphodiesterase [Psidium guajava]
MWKKDIDEDEADRFLQLMITDRCFMLEILRFANKEVNDYAPPNDPIFSDRGKLYILPVIRRDMLLLENQLPMLVLDRLVAVCDDKKEDEYINRLILNFFCSTSPNNPRMGKCLHVLDVFRKNLVQPTLHNVASMGSQSNTRTRKFLHVPDVFGKSLLMEWRSKGAYDLIPSATELREHGILFDQSDTDSLEDISFASGVLRLPVIAVEDTTESMFLNLIAFQHSHVGAGTEVWAGTELTSYICLMDNLIDKGQDVALLRKKGIIENYMESDEAAAKLFNSLAKDVMLDPHSSLHDVMNNVREYCKKRRHKWRANLMHNYFRNPWVISSLIAAFLLFGLTTIQTVYTVLGSKK